MKYLQLLAFGSAFFFPLQTSCSLPDLGLVDTSLGNINLNFELPPSTSTEICDELAPLAEDTNAADDEQNKPKVQVVSPIRQRPDTKSYPVSQIRFAYDLSHPHHIPFVELEQIKISLYEKEGVFYSPDELKGNETQGQELKTITIEDINYGAKPTLLTEGALEAIVHGVSHDFLARNIDWTVAYIPNCEIDRNGDDLRPRTDTTLTIAISTPIVKNTSVEFVDPDNPSKKIDNPKLASKICDQLPLSLPDPSTGYPGDFINSNLLNNYLHALNRHPKRRVDLEIGPTDVPGEVAFDFIVTQKRPWHFYFNANNNTPKPIDRWEESVGFIHTQLTNNDDIFKLNASSDSFDKFYSVDASYEAPIGRSIGNRWQIYGNYNRFVSAEFALPQNLFVGTQAIFKGEIISTVAQWDKLFLDFVANLQYRHIHNRGHEPFSSATKNFLLPGIGLNAIQLKRETKLIASLSLQSTMSSLFWDVRKHLDDLGRRDLSPNWAILQGGLYGSFYLEPLFQKSNKVKQLANEIVFIGQLQNGFNQRLIPELEGILGGLYTIRGYPQSTISGDNMYMGSLEYRFHLPAALKIDPNACTKIFGKSFRWAPARPKGDTDWDFLFRVFYDVGDTRVNQRKHSERNHLIMGAGLGAELVFWQNILIRADWGTAFKSANGISAGHHQFYFSSTIMY
jgi:hypothetical protein